MTPIRFHWSGDPGILVNLLQIGKSYECEEITDAERSLESHDHYFACVKKGWENLPEWLADRFPGERTGPNKLRKWCLCKRGYRREFTGAMETGAQLAAIMQMALWIDEYAVVVSEGLVVTVYVAKSQKMRKNGGDMSKREFEQSKADVLEEISLMIGTDVATLLKESGRNA